MGATFCETGKFAVLAQLQTERRELRKPEMDDAVRLFKTQRMKGLRFDPAEFGFVHSSAEIARESTRRDRLHDSLLAEKPPSTSRNMNVANALMRRMSACRVETLSTRSNLHFSNIDT